MKMQIDKRNGVSSGDKKEGDDSKDVADNSSENSNGDGGKTRKKSDKNMENYRKIVIADDSEATSVIRAIIADVYKTGM